MCFLDISGYTRLTEERGDEAAAELAGRLSRLVQQTAERHRGKVVRWLGDGVMIYFREPGQGVLAALQMMKRSRMPACHRHMSAFTPGPWCSRGATTTAALGSP
jgi:class 3 adenylate cyclase